VRSGENGNTAPAGNGTLDIEVDENNRLESAQERLLCSLLGTK